MAVWGWMTEIVSSYGYLGAFLISIFGNFTIFFPVPYVLTIYAFGASLNPLLLGLACGLGATIGEFSAYMIGRGGRRIIDERYGDKLDTAKKLIEKHGVWIIFWFAVLPLPDDLILIPLGMLRYDLKRAMVAVFTGKIIMCTAVAYAGRYSYTFVRDIFSSNGILGGILSTVLLAVSIIVLLKYDWAKLIDAELE